MDIYARHSEDGIYAEIKEEEIPILEKHILHCLDKVSGVTDQIGVHYAYLALWCRKPFGSDFFLSGKMWYSPGTARILEEALEVNDIS